MIASAFGMKYGIPLEEEASVYGSTLWTRGQESAGQEGRVAPVQTAQRPSTPTNAASFSSGHMANASSIEVWCCFPFSAKLA